MTKNNIAFIFPGQGAQKTGMGLDFYENFDVAKNIFDKADEILNKPVSKICFEGPDEVLRETINTQSALLTLYIAILETLKSKIDIVPKFVAGHSLGEYGALYAANVLDFKTACLAIQKRSELMADATKNVENTGMSAVLGLGADEILPALCEGVEIANYNEPKQIVLTGVRDKIDEVSEKLKSLGARRVIPLAVSGAFHSSFMKNASAEFEKFLQKIEINEANIPVITNVDAEITTEAKDFRIKMAKQISSSVHWTQTICKMMDFGVDTFVEIGCGQVLAGLNKKICNENIKTYTINSKESLNSTIDLLK